MLSSAGIKVFTKFFFIGTVGMILFYYLIYLVFMAEYFFGSIIGILIWFVIAKWPKIFTSSFKDFGWKISGLVLGFFVGSAVNNAFLS